MNRRYAPQNHRRRSIRLKAYDYSQAGNYFITIVTQDRECLFGEIKDHEMSLNQAGEMIKATWEQLPNRFPNIETGNFVVMPNHIHGIVAINDVGAPLVGAPPTNATNAPSTKPTPAPENDVDVVGRPLWAPHPTTQPPPQKTQAQPLWTPHPPNQPTPQKTT